MHSRKCAPRPTPFRPRLDAPAVHLRQLLDEPTARSQAPPDRAAPRLRPAEHVEDLRQEIGRDALPLVRSRRRTRSARRPSARRSPCRPVAELDRVAHEFQRICSTRIASASNDDGSIRARHGERDVVGARVDGARLDHRMQHGRDIDRCELERKLAVAPATGRAGRR